MVASSVASSSVSARKSTTTTTATMKSPPPHMLGGSKNLMTERFRREQAEQALLRTKQSLKSMTTELVPQVEELTKAVQEMQIEKHQQLDLDAASQEVLEGLQEQIHEIVTREAAFATALDNRMEGLLRQIHEDFRAERFEFQVVVSGVQDAQDEVLAEVRLLSHEISATKDYLSQRLSAVDDAVECIRSETTRSRQQQDLALQGFQARLAEFDERLFGLDKELLKIKLALPTSVGAQIPTKFDAGVATSEAARLVNQCDANRGTLGVTQRLEELSCQLEATKTELIAYRNADRQQFDALTNRLRESSKCQQSYKRELDQRLHEVQAAHAMMMTRMPSELSKRLLTAQGQWEEEIRSLRGIVEQLQRAQPPLLLASGSESIDDGATFYDPKTLRSLDTAIGRHEDRLAGLQSEVATLKTEVETMCHGHETTTSTLGTIVSRLEGDVLGLYDWTRDKVSTLQEEVTFTSELVQYFQRHAKILPKNGI